MRSNKPFQNTFEAKGIRNEGPLRSFREGLARLHSVRKAGLKMVKVRWVVFCDGRSFNPIKTRFYFVVNLTIQQINFRNSKLIFHKDTACAWARSVRSLN